MTIREALLSMGYREEKPGKWCKPVGYHLFTYEESRAEWANWFRGVDGALRCYDRERIEGEDSLSKLKTQEAFTRISVGNGDSEFQLSAIDL